MHVQGSSGQANMCILTPSVRAHALHRFIDCQKRASFEGGSSSAPSLRQQAAGLCALHAWHPASLPGSQTHHCLAAPGRWMA